jgi:hypothetical protein
MNVAGTGVNARPMLIKAYRIESRRHGSIDCQPVLMGILHFTENIAQGQLFEQERVAVNLVVDHSPFSHDVMRGAETWDAESTNGERLQKPQQSSDTLGRRYAFFNPRHLLERASLTEHSSDAGGDIIISERLRSKNGSSCRR